MKKPLFLSLSLTVAVLSASAQNWNAGFGGGYLHNHFSTKKSDVKTKDKAGFRLESVFDYELPSHLTLSSGIAFSQKGSEMTFPQGDAYEHLRRADIRSMYYLSLPITVGYSFHWGKVTILPQAGLYTAIGIGGKAEVDGTDNDQRPFTRREMKNVFNSPEVSHLSYFNPFDFGATIALNATYGHLRLKVYYEHSLHEELNRAWGQPRHRNAGVSLIYLLK